MALRFAPELRFFTIVSLIRVSCVLDMYSVPLSRATLFHSLKPSPLSFCLPFCPSSYICDSSLISRRSTRRLSAVLVDFSLYAQVRSAWWIQKKEQIIDCCTRLVSSCLCKEAYRTAVILPLKIHNSRDYLYET